MKKRRLEKGLLIVLEGIDGAGKTTQAERLHTLLEQEGWDVIRTKEPTDGEWGQKLRASAQTGRLSPEQELDYFIKDRKQHVEQRLSPALEQGKVVIVDRYYFSTAAYQGARGMDPDELLRLNESFAPPPDLLVLLEVDPAVGIRRIRQRGDRENLFEAESSLRAVARVFKQIKRPYLHCVDGTLPIDAITHGLLEKLHAGPLSTMGRQSFDEPTTGDLCMEVARLSAKRPARH